MNGFFVAAHADCQPNGDTHAVQVAYEALSRFGDELTRDQAAALLETWTWQPALSPTEVGALLARFPEELVMGGAG